MDEIPAVLGGRPAFDELLPIVRPSLPPFDRAFQNDVRLMMESGHLTKGPHLARFEDELAAALGVRFAIAVSSCTIGLIIVLDSLSVQGREVIVPSFTFMATVNAIVWAGAEPVFVDVDSETWNVDPSRVEAAITPRTAAIVAVHNFGNPAPAETLESIAHQHGVRLLFDAAHGFGSRYRGVPVGSFGDAEVFSLSPTKLLVAGEGGVVTTNDEAIAARVRLAREYGNAGGYDALFPGLNARLPEFSALLAWRGLKALEENTQRREKVAGVARDRLESLPGLRFQRVAPEDRSSWKDLSVAVDALGFGLTRNELVHALRAENIETRTYHDPPVHAQTAYRTNGRRADPLAVTERIASRMVTLPIWSHMDDGTAGTVWDTVSRIHRNSKAVRDSLAQPLSMVRGRS